MDLRVCVMRDLFFRKLFSIVTVINFVLNGIAAFGQVRVPGKTKVVPAAAEKKQGCAGGWSGVVTYSKTLKDSLESDEPGIRKNTDRIQHKTSRDYDYEARTVVDGTDPRDPVVTSKVAFQDIDLSWGLEKVFDTCNSREAGHWFNIEGTDDRHTQAQAEGPATSFNLNVNETGGTYSFSMGLPEATGTYKREEHVKRTGHCQPKNNEPYDRSTNEPFKMERQAFSVDSEKIDPEHPDQLSGTKIWGDDGKGEVRTFIYKVTWRFTRCPQKLLITELKFEHPKFPNYEDWRAIEEIRGTIDGNHVKVKAKVLNLSGETKYADLKVVETYKGDKYNGARPDEPLTDAESSFRIDAGEEKEFEFIWDSEGQAWFDDGRPHLLHRIKAELSENSQKKDEKEERLNIAPKPLILVHGVYNDHSIWDPLYQNLLSANHSYQWKAYAVGAEPQHGVMRMGKWNGTDASFNSVYDNADQLAKYIKYAQEDSNAWHVDMVAHSTGGLVARLYLHKLMPNVPDARPQVKHLMMLGTPNGGVPCVDIFVGKLGMFKNDQRSLHEVTNDAMLDFNKYVVNTGGTKLSARAGNPVPVVCGGLEWNDGFVTVKSATYGVPDNSQANDLSSQLVDAKNFGNFVKPHVVTGPAGKYPLPVKSDPADWRRWQVENQNYDLQPQSGANRGKGAAPEFMKDGTFAAVFGQERISGPGLFDPEIAASDVEQIFAKQVTLPAKQTAEIDVPVAAAPNFGITFVASPAVSVSLINERGEVVSRDAADSPFAGRLFRSVLTHKAVPNATWKLRIQNTSATDQVFAGFGWSLADMPAASMPAARAK